MTEHMALKILIPYVTAGFGITTVIFMVAWFRALQRAVRAEAVLAHLKPDASRTNDRIETAVDAVALELERLAEGQRFVARILTERSGSDALRLSGAGRIITPH